MGAVYTVSTILKGPNKGAPASPVPESKPSMPLPYFDDFEGYEESQEGKWWADQIGVFEVHPEVNGSSGNKVMRQMVPELPIGWSDGGSNGPVSILGMREWQDITVEASFRLPASLQASAAACIAARVDQMWHNGLVLCVSAGGAWSLAAGGPKLGSPPKQGFAGGSVASLPPGAFCRLSLTTIGDRAWGWLEAPKGARWSLFQGVHVRDFDTGFAAIGASDWFAVEFDDISVKQAGPNWHAVSPCPDAGAGARLRLRRCVANGLAVEDQAFDLLSNWGIRHVKSGLCVAADAPAAGAQLALAACDGADMRQQLRNDYTSVRNHAVPFSLSSLLLTGHPLNASVSVEQKAGKDGASSFQSWSYFPNTRQLRNQYVASEEQGYPLCLSLCPDSPTPLTMAYI